MSASWLYDTQANYPSKKKHISANYNTKKEAPPEEFDSRYIYSTSTEIRQKKKHLHINSTG